MQKLGGFLAHVDGAFDLYRKRPRDPRSEGPAVLHASPAGRSVILQRLETIMKEQRDRVNGWQDATAAALLEVLVTVARLRLPDRTAAPAASPMADRSEQAVLDVASHLETHFAEPVSLGELSARVHLSPGHLSRSFARRMGMGIVEYMHRMRAEEACRLLRCTDEPIGNIATRVGYAEIAYFSRCFRAQLHQSPIEYRRHARGRAG
jgi:transcriptional regulator GlxA family with amidase domain